MESEDRYHNCYNMRVIMRNVIVLPAIATAPLSVQMLTVQAVTLMTFHRTYISVGTV